MTLFHFYYLRVCGSSLCGETGFAGTVEVGHVASQRHQQVGRRVPKLVVLPPLVPDLRFETLCAFLLIGERSDFVSLKLHGIEEVGQAGISKGGAIACVSS